MTAGRQLESYTSSEDNPKATSLLYLFVVNLFMISHVSYQTVESKVDDFKSAVVETPIYHKTSEVMSTAAEKTSSLFTGFTTKLSQMKNSESFKSFEGKVGGAYESVKTKVSTSRSGSVQSFNDMASANNTAPTSPIHEEKPIA